MISNQATASQTTRTKSNKDWIENNADRTKRIFLTAPRLTFKDWQDAGDKSGLSMTGLMMAAAEFLRQTDGAQLQEMARRSASLQGVRLQYVDQETGETRRVSAGPYRKGPANE